MGRLACFRDDLGSLRQSRHVQNQRHAPVPHDRCPRVCADAFELLSQRFDHDLLGIGDLVHNETELPVFRLQRHNVDCRLAGRIAAAVLNPEFPIQVHQGQQPSAQAIHRSAMDQLNSFSVLDSV
jgi:hypothetical protein